jgi:hypothetical protein
MVDFRNPASVAAFARGDFAHGLAAATEGGIANQEKEGQASLGGFDRLPVSKFSNRHQLEALGFVVHEPVDDIFTRVTPPPGWSLKATEDSMWSHLYDVNGRLRAWVFYKAAFYDRNAHMRLESRYRVDRAYFPDGSGHGSSRIVDGSTGEVLLAKPFREDYRLTLDDDQKLAVELKSRFPDHADPVAYW